VKKCLHRSYTYWQVNIIKVVDLSYVSFFRNIPSPVITDPSKMAVDASGTVFICGSSWISPGLPSISDCGELRERELLYPDIVIEPEESGKMFVNEFNDNVELADRERELPYPDIIIEPEESK